MDEKTLKLEDLISFAGKIEEGYEFKINEASKLQEKLVKNNEERETITANLKQTQIEAAFDAAKWKAIHNLVKEKFDVEIESNVKEKEVETKKDEPKDEDGQVEPQKVE